MLDTGTHRVGRVLSAGGDSHLDISVIPMLGHRLYTCEYRLGARVW
jgi:hypothetical protein